MGAKSRSNYAIGAAFCKACGAILVSGEECTCKMKEGAFGSSEKEGRADRK